MVDGVRKPLLPLLIVTITLMAVSASAEAYMSGGWGASSCGAWTEARRTGRGIDAEQWILGFLSGIGWLGGSRGYDPLNGTDAQGIWAWMDAYCHARPLDTVETAGGAFATAHPH